MNRINLSGLSSRGKPTTKTIRPLKGPIGLLGRDHALRKSGSQAELASGDNQLGVGEMVDALGEYPARPPSELTSLMAVRYFGRQQSQPVE